MKYAKGELALITVMMIHKTFISFGEVPMKYIYAVFWIAVCLYYVQLILEINKRPMPKDSLIAFAADICYGGIILETILRIAECL